MFSILVLKLFLRSFTYILCTCSIVRKSTELEISPTFNWQVSTVKWTVSFEEINYFFLLLISEIENCCWFLTHILLGKQANFEFIMITVICLIQENKPSTCLGETNAYGVRMFNPVKKNGAVFL